MKTSNVIFALVLAGAVGAGGYWLGARHPAAGDTAAATSGTGAAPRRPGQDAQAALLPQPHGAGRHLAHAEEGPDGHGLHPGLRGRRPGQRRCGGRQPDPHQHRQDPETGRAGRDSRHAGARQDRARGRTGGAGRAARLLDLAQVRGLRGTAARQRHRPAGRQGPAAVRGLQPRAGVGPARVHHRPAGHAGHEQCGQRGPGRNEAIGRLQPGAAAQLGPFARTARDAGQDRRGQADHHFPLAGVGHRHREEGTAGHALHARRIAVPGDRPVLGLGDGRRLRAGHRAGQDRHHGQREDQRLPRQVVQRQDHLHLSHAQGRDPHGAGAHRARQPRPVAQAGHVRPGRTAGGRQGGRAGDSRVVRDRQRHPPGGAGPAAGGPLRTARGQARRQRQQLRGGARRRPRRRAGGGRRQLPDRRGEQPQGRHRRAGYGRHVVTARRGQRSRRGRTGRRPGRRRPQGPGHGGQHRRQGRHRQPESRRHRVAEMAGDDHGVQGRQSVAAEGPEAGRAGLVRIRRAPARRMGDHLAHPRGEGRLGRPAPPAAEREAPC